MRKNKLLTVNNNMCQTVSRKFAADSIYIDQLHYLNAECHFWVLYHISTNRTSRQNVILYLYSQPWTAG